MCLITLVTVSVDALRFFSSVYSVGLKFLWNENVRRKKAVFDMPIPAKRNNDTISYAACACRRIDNTIFF